MQLLSRRPPFGHDLLEAVRRLPRYAVTVKEIATTMRSGEPLSMALEIYCRLLDDDIQDKPGKETKRRTSRFLGMTSILTIMSDLDLVDYRRIPSVSIWPTSHLLHAISRTKALSKGKSFSITASLSKPSQSILVQVSPVGPSRENSPLSYFKMRSG